MVPSLRRTEALREKDKGVLDKLGTRKPNMTGRGELARELQALTSESCEDLVKALAYSQSADKTSEGFALRGPGSTYRL